MRHGKTLIQNTNHLHWIDAIYAVVTGANKGIGLETVKQLASKAMLFEGLDFEVNNAGIGGVKLDADAFKASEYSGGGEKFNLSNEPHGNMAIEDHMKRRYYTWCYNLEMS
ncbi:unnamed protein product [Prunus armeniaca]